MCFCMLQTTTPMQSAACTPYLDGVLRYDDVITLWVAHGELLPLAVQVSHPGCDLSLVNWVCLHELVEVL